ncbi:hypothetical protein LTR27_001850 [Elasticomyces elasticus]|nr:hypothetical protein LTR27_001850 [Elasticomyces elasticus]
MGGGQLSTSRRGRHRKFSAVCLRPQPVPEHRYVANPTLAGCGDSRGYLFQRNQSTTWSTERLANAGLYQLNTFVESKIGLTGNAYYGFDVLSLGLPGSDLPSLQGQTIAGFATNDFWVGSIGLSPYPMNFTHFDTPQNSMLSTLLNQSFIPSLSWSYTAGAYYQDPPVLGSLTLGGYDSTRFVPNNVSFAMYSDFSTDLLVGLTAVTYDTLGSSPLLTQTVNVYIDSLVTELWLPLDACRAFEAAFDLVWNNTAQLYLVNETTHKGLLQQNPQFTFSLAQPGAPNGTVDIVIPYAAFDLNVTNPLVDTSTWYFPLKQAQNESQYILGRAFLQEAYVTADYSRGNFSVSQALFPATSVPQDIVSIRPPLSKSVSSSAERTVSTGVVAGAAIAGVVVVAAALALGVWLALKRRRKLKDQQEQQKLIAGHDALDEKPDQTNQLLARSAPPHEASGAQIHEADDRHGVVPELQAQSSTAGKYELGHGDRRHELSGREVSVIELEAPLR